MNDNSNEGSNALDTWLLEMANNEMTRRHPWRRLLRETRHVPHLLIFPEIFAVLEGLRQVLVERFRQEQGQQTAQNAHDAENQQRQDRRDNVQVNDEGRENAGDVSHYVDQGDSLSPHDRWQHLGCVLKTDVVRDVHPESTDDRQGGRVDL